MTDALLIVASIALCFTLPYVWKALLIWTAMLLPFSVALALMLPA
jgi:hypothetical protein